jgi:hypothetical protein
MGKMLKQIACVAALSASSFAQADILNFEKSYDSPWLFQGDHIEIGNFWIETYNQPAQVGDMVGAIIDGSDSGSCLTGGCPVNNASQYYAGLGDGYMYFGMNDNSTFRLSSLKASFIGAGQASFPSVAGVLVLQGFNADGSLLGGAFQLGLGGPTGGSFKFSTYDLSPMSNFNYSYVRVLGYGCDPVLGCVRNANLSNFGLDDITTITAVPEPGSVALFGLGALGMAAFTRRRRAV